MSRRLYMPCVSVALVALSLTACNGSSKSSSGTGSSVTDEPTEVATSASSSGDVSDLASLHMCSTLKEADALALGKQFNIGQSATAKYKFMTEMEKDYSSESPTASCTFTIYQVLPDGTGGSEAIVDIVVRSANDADPIGAKKVDIGIGDYALDQGDYDQVIFGNKLIESDSSQGASKDLINAMFKAIIPNIS